ncbi:MAG: hypothetical protein HKN23_01850 [Verrucomicrobiales bacterium]|nr:hypothetical protein [Verrucomicrobiales bacterium]
MSEKMENPYEKFGAHACEVAAGRRWLWIFAGIFCLGIVAAPIGRNLYEALKSVESGGERWIPVVKFWDVDNEKTEEALRQKRKKNASITRTEPILRDHLQAFEGEIKKADFRDAIASREQKTLTGVFEEGNLKVRIGRDGWFFYQPAVDALTRYGPLRPEPDSVMKDPDRPEWNPAGPVIERFADQLQERNIELLLVPVPVKAMIHPEHFDAGLEAPLQHPDQEAFYEKLRSHENIELLDLTDLFLDLKAKNGPVFLKQDTHWTHDTMQAAAAAVAAAVNEKPWFDSLDKNLEVKTETVTRSHQGDLVGMLSLPDSAALFSPETQEIECVLDAETGKPLTDDPASPIVLLGDSFVNIYNTPGIGFGEEGESEIGAGFAAALARNLGTRLHSFTSNGEGATGVRRDFARMGKSDVAKKKLVIWVVAARDLLLSETPGISAGVQWKDGVCNTGNTYEQGPATVIATVAERSGLGNPKQTPYENSLFSTLVEVESVEEGGPFGGKQAQVFLWGFQKRKLLPASNLKVGDRVRLDLIPMAEADATEGTKGANRSDDLFLMDPLPQMFARKFTPLAPTDEPK